MHMFSATGPNGQLSLKDSDLKFENWVIKGKRFGPNEPDLDEFHGCFEIQMSDFGKFFSLANEQTIAEFYGDKNYQGKIILDFPEPRSVSFKGMGNLSIIS